MSEINSKISYVGMGIGSIALLLALVHFWAGPFSPQMSLEQTVAEKAVSIREATINALKGKGAPEPQQREAYNTDDFLNVGTAVLGGISIILGLFGFVKREPKRAALAAGMLGGGAIAFQFAAWAVMAIVCAIIVGAILQQIGIDI